VTNRALLGELYEYLKGVDTSENYQNQRLKQLIGYAQFLGNLTFYEIAKKRTEDGGIL
jgi:hypothetical protein